MKHFLKNLVCYIKKLYQQSKLKRKKPNFKINQKLTKGIIKSIKIKNKLYKKYLICPNETNKNRYKKYNNKINHLKRISKKKYYDNQFKQNKDDLKKTWKIINEVINKSKNKDKLPKIFSNKDRLLSDRKEIADSFNDYFINVGKTLAEKISTSPKTYQSYMGPHNPHSFYINPTNKKEVET